MAEPTGERIYRWADRAGWTGPRAIDTGWSRLLADADLEGNALDQMQKLAFEEGMGSLFMDADGALTFYQRDSPVTKPRMANVQATFTDRDGDPAGACYSDIVPVADSIPVYNQVEMGSAPSALWSGVTREQVGGGVEFAINGFIIITPTDNSLQPGLVQRYSDPDSIAWYGPRSYPTQTDLALIDWNDDLAICILIVVTHADNELRVEHIIINATRAHLDVWNVACNVRLLDRVRVVRHFPGGYVLDEDLIVQGIHHHMEGTGERTPGVWQVTYDTARAMDMTNWCAWDVGQWDDCRWSI